MFFPSAAQCWCTWYQVTPEFILWLLLLASLPAVPFQVILTFVLSFNRAAKAQQLGLFKAEIVPVKTTVQDKEGNQQTITVHQDEGIRPSTTLEGLAKLKPAFKENGSTTAGQLCLQWHNFLPFPWLACPVAPCAQAEGVVTDLFQQATPARSVMEQLQFCWQNAPKQHSWGCRCWGCSSPSPWSESRPMLWALGQPTPSLLLWRRQVRTTLLSTGQNCSLWTEIWGDYSSTCS